MTNLAVGSLDGRQSRTERSRRAICDACLDLIGEGVLQPSADEVAERSGVSRRSIFNHFADLAELYDAVLEVGIERAELLKDEVPSEGSLADRVAALVDVRVRFLEACAPFTRALTLQSLVGTLSAQAIRISRKGLRLQYQFYEERLGRDLAGLSEVARRDLLEGLTSVTSPLAWEHLRVGRSLSLARAALVMRRSFVALLRDAGIEL